MRKFIQTFPLHSLLFAVYPIISLYIHNINMVPVEQTFRPLLISVGACGLLFALFYLLVRDVHRAGFAVSGLLILFFSFGHIRIALMEGTILGLRYNRPDVLFSAWAGMFVFCIWFNLRALRAGQNLTHLFNIVSAALLLFSLASIFANPASFDLLNKATASPSLPGSQDKEMVHRPDVYYIVLDSYGRQDMIEALYGYDNSWFIEALESRGFYVADESHSNYAYTALSLASSLNFRYLDELVPLNNNSDNLEPLTSAIKNNALMQFYKSNGYQTVEISSAYDGTVIPTVDHLYRFEDRWNDFEDIVIETSYASMLVLLDYYPPYWSANIRSLSDLKDAVQIEGPKFVFAHIMITHLPFVFEPDGSFRQTIVPTRRNTSPDWLSNFIEAYPDQVQFADQAILEVIDLILSQPGDPPVIIVQGDHGPDAYLDIFSVEDSCIAERFGILNAYFVPEEIKAQLYPSISPVNTFRLLLGEYFEGGLPLLPDSAYFSNLLGPYQLVEVTSLLDRPCTVP
ncbi:MAG: LTA synthase family protein [Chloroflexi bacterium]|nr:LTA synthase family protein [Chloroflexota bacterium]